MKKMPKQSLFLLSTSEPRNLTSACADAGVDPVVSLVQSARVVGLVDKRYHGSLIDNVDAEDLVNNG